MRIRRLRIDGFGNLRGEYIFSSDRCNLVLEPNESGKSTLAAALMAALYGFPRQRATRDRPIKLKERYRPWSGGAFGVELELQCGERSFIVRRDFEGDSVSVRDGLSGAEITQEFAVSKDQIDVGEKLTGLSREEFARCCFVGQGAIDIVRDAAGLTHALQRIASSQQGDVAASEAIEALARAVDQDYKGMRLGKGKVDTEIRRLEKEIDEVRTEMEQIASRRRDSEAKIRSLEETTSREGRAEADLARVDFLSLLAAREEASLALEQCRRDQGELEAYQEELERLTPYASFPAEKLGELRELKGSLDAQLHRRIEALEARQAREDALGRAEETLAAHGGFGGLGEPDAAAAADREAVLNDLWKQRRDKRRAVRAEERRLRGAGVQPERVTELASRFAELSEEDRSFLGAYRESSFEIKAALNEAELERDRLAHLEGGQPLLSPLMAARRAETLALMVGVLGIILTPILYFLLENKTPILLTLALALGGFLWWFKLVEAKPVPGAEQFGSDLQKVQTEVWSREKDLAALQERLGALASRAGYPKAERLVDEFRELELLQDKAAGLTTLAASLQDVKRRYEGAASELLDLMQRAGRVPPGRRLTPRVARAFRAELRAYLEKRHQIGALRAELDADRDEIAALGVDIELLRSRILDVLGPALQPEPLPEDLSAALTMFERAAEKRERHDRIRSESLPAALRRHRVQPAVRAEELARDLEVLERRIEPLLRDNPAYTAIAPRRSSREYTEERRRLVEEIRATQRERNALSEELGDVLKEYRRDYPGRQQLLVTLESALTRAMAFRDSVGIAAETLAAISREAYAEWAEVLNEKTSDIMRRLNPSYDDVRFDTDLTFTLRDTRGGVRRDQAEVDMHFSGGARDQIYLAIRMAVAEYLSSGGVRLPIVLDDPFAMFDDARFSRVMEFLLDTVARRHQIILLSCHEERHRRWQQEVPEHLADRVRLLDLTPLSA